MGNDLRNLHWLPVRKRILFKIALLAYKSINGLSPVYLQDMLRYSHYGHTLTIIVSSVYSSFGRISLSYIGPKIYNNLPLYISSSENVDSFKKLLKTYLFNLSVQDLESLIS